jgi:hypothetical protein
VAVVAGRVRVLRGLADRGGHDDAVVRDLLHRSSERSGATIVAGRDGHLEAADDVEDRRQVHVDADGNRGVPAGQPARGDEYVVRRGDPEAAVLLGNRRCEVPRAPESLEALERVAAFAVVLAGAGREVLGERLGQRHQAAAGLGLGC